MLGYISQEFLKSLQQFRPAIFLIYPLLKNIFASFGNSIKALSE